MKSPYAVAALGGASLAVIQPILGFLPMGRLLALVMMVPASGYIMHRILQATPRPWNEPTSRRLHLAGGLFTTILLFSVVAGLISSLASQAGLYDLAMPLNAVGINALIAMTAMGIYLRASLRCDHLGLERPTSADLLRALITFGR